MTDAVTLDKIREQIGEMQVALAKLTSHNEHLDFIMIERKIVSDAASAEVRAMSDRLNTHIKETHTMLGAIHAKINFAAGAVAVITAAATFVFQFISAKFKGA